MVAECTQARLSRIDSIEVSTSTIMASSSSSSSQADAISPGASTLVPSPRYEGSPGSSKPLKSDVRFDSADGSIRTDRTIGGWSSARFGKDNKSEGTKFTESTDVPRRHLGFFQTVAFILNGSLGGGFFLATPNFVLALVPSKWICLILWIVGGIYSFMGYCIWPLLCSDNL